MNASWRKISGVLLVVLLVALGLYAARNTDFGRGDRNTEAMHFYSNDLYGISFEYPEGYLLVEREVGDLHRAHYNITLFPDTPFVRDLLAGKVVGTEAPPAISVDIYQNNLDKQSIEAWVKGTNNSNFKLSPDEVITETAVGGAPALSYTWDGLYRGDSAVFAHKENILMLSVTYHTPEDTLRSDFKKVVDSIKLSE